MTVSVIVVPSRSPVIPRRPVLWGHAGISLLRYWLLIDAGLSPIKIWILLKAFLSLNFRERPGVGQTNSADSSRRGATAEDELIVCPIMIQVFRPTPTPPYPVPNSREDKEGLFAGHLRYLSSEPNRAYSIGKLKVL